MVGAWLFGWQGVECCVDWGIRFGECIDGSVQAEECCCALC